MKDVVGGFDAALEYLTSEILNGTVGPGERLPNERELAAQLGASRSAVREAIKVLQAQGVVTSQTGPRGGTRVATGQGAALGRVLKLHIALGAISFDEVTHTRVELERVAAEAAAGAGELESKQAFEFLATLVAEMRETTDAAAYNDLDTRFHVGIAGLAANRLIRDITIAIREAVAGQILVGEQALSDWEQLRGILNEDHAEILAALQAGEGERAAQLCEDHIRRAHRVLIGDK